MLNSTLDADESQHLHAAWLVAQGYVPFVDFWEHHTPVLYYLLAPLTRWFAESPRVYVAGRAVMATTGGAALVLVYLLARRLSRTTAMVAILLLAFLSRFVEHTTEVRPDPPALVLWLAALLALVRWAEDGRSRWLWLAGAALGGATAFTPKALYSVLGATATVAITAWGRRPKPSAILVALMQVAAGAVAPLLILLGGLWLAGGRPALAGFVTDVVLDNLRFADFAKITPVPEEGVGPLLLGLAGVVLTLRRAGWGVLRHPVHGPMLLTLAGVSVVLALPTTPAVYRHAWLPVLPLLAVYGALALLALVEYARASDRRWAKALVGLAVVAGLGVPMVWQIRNAVRDANQAQIDLMREQLRDTCPGEAVLDGTALAVFRPSAQRYGVLVTGIREWIARGALSEQRLVDDLYRTRPPVAYVDIRVRGLIGPVADFLRRYYVGRRGGLLRLGATISSADPGGGSSVIELLVTDVYRLSVSPGMALTADGAAIHSGFVRLRQGRHVLAWTAAAGPIHLVIASCPERRALGGGDGDTALR